MQPIKNPEKFELFHVAKGIMFTYVYHPQEITMFWLVLWLPFPVMSGIDDIG